MFLIIMKNRLYLLISFIMTAITACSCSQTFTVLEYGPDTASKFPKLQFPQNMEPGVVLHVIASTTSISHFDLTDFDKNVLMRVEPRIASNVVGFGSYFGSWGPDETSSTMPIKNGVKYSMHIVHQLSGYRIFINGEELYFFKHRSRNPGVSFEMLPVGQCYFASHKFNEPKWAVQQSYNSKYINEFSDAGKESPHEIQFQESRPLSSIVITGIINSNVNNVVFSLLDSCDEEIFSFDIRLQENSVVCNSFIKGVWGKEERYGAMVFQENKRFTLAIDVEDKFYKIYVDGVEFITYNHRAPPTNVTKLKISAGIKIFKTIYLK